MEKLKQPMIPDPTIFLRDCLKHIDAPKETNPGVLVQILVFFLKILKI